MTDFLPYYTSVFRRGDNVFIREISGKGKRENLKIKYEPTLYFVDKDGDSGYKTLKGEPLKGVKFSSISQAKAYADATDKVIYGYNRWEYACLQQRYSHEIKHDFSELKVVWLDIETESIGHFSSVENPDQPITLIQLLYRGTFYIFGTDIYESYDDKVKYIKCSDEIDLIKKFVHLFRKIDPDILSNWNGSGFDVPMIYSRMKYLDMEDLFKKLSPFNMIDVYEDEVFGKPQLRVDILGVQNLDYMNMVRKFDQRRFINYKLDTVAKEITGKQKVKYVGNLGELRVSNFEQFVAYGIRDVQLLQDIDDSVNLIELLVMLGYKSKTNFEDAFYQVRMWDCTFNDYLITQGIQVPYREFGTDYITEDYDEDERYEGAYVKPVVPGKYNWVISDDVQSLYPSIIMAWNMSPETYRGFAQKNVDYFVNQFAQDEEFKNMIKNNNVSVASNGSMFSREKLGFIPDVLNAEFLARVDAKNKAKDAKKEMEKIKKILTERGVSI